MKNVFLGFTILFLLVGCMGLQPPPKTEPVEAGIPIVNDEKTATVGDTFFEYTYLGGLFGSNSMYNLVIIELNEQKLGLQYSEYVYQSNPYTYTSGWMIKQGFNKRFEYAVADGIVRFKGYEFEIIGVDKGQIKYRRIK